MQVPTRHAYSIIDVVRTSGISRSSIYAAIKAGDLVVRKLGRRTVVLPDDLNGWLESLPKAPHGSATES